MTPEKLSVEYDHAFAIVRVDGYYRDIKDMMEKPEVLITVKRIVWSKEQAESEVARLNRLNAEKDSIYFSTITRVDKRAAQDS